MSMMMLPEGQMADNLQKKSPMSMVLKSQLGTNFNKLDVRKTSVTVVKSWTQVNSWMLMSKKLILKVNF